MKLLVDTSLLMLSVELGKNLIEIAEKELDEKLELYTLEDVIRELEGIAKGRGKKSRMARVALAVASNFKIIRYLGEISVDEKIVKAAEELKIPLATVDLEIIRKARKKNIPILIFHKDLRITFEGWRE
ncbi:MAG: PIN domain-containing protein [Candidatus Caldarchaeales archaeon]